VKFDIHDKVEGDQKRFILGLSGAPKLFVLGVNPSAANKEKSDTTITKVATFSSNLGFGGFVMLNIYPQRATSPGGLHLNSDSKLVDQNKEVICSLMRGKNQMKIWAAWGNLIVSRNYLWDCLEELADELKEFNPIWKHCGKPTNMGHPRHPSRLAYKENFFEFDIFEYLKEKRILTK
jgi:hypothetical protein